MNGLFLHNEIVIIIVILFLCFILCYATKDLGLRIFRSRDSFYKNSVAQPLSDESFYEIGGFFGRMIPKEYALAKRIELSDCLDFPSNRLHPDMIWENIPYRPHMFRFYYEWVDDLHDYIKALGYDSDSFLSGRTISQIIDAFYQVERIVIWNSMNEYPPGWELEISKLKKKLKYGKQSLDFFANHTIADVIIVLYKIRKNIQL